MNAFFTKKWYPTNLIVLIVLIILIIILIWGGATNWKFIPKKADFSGTFIYKIQTSKINTEKMIGYLSDSSKFGSIKPTNIFDEQTILSVYTFPNTFGVFLKAKSTIILQQNFFDHIKVQGENNKIYTLYVKDALFSPLSGMKNSQAPEDSYAWIWHSKSRPNLKTKLVKLPNWNENTEYLLQFFIGDHPSPKPSPHPSPKPSPHPSSKPSPHPSPKPSPHPSPKPSPHPSPKPSPHPSPKPKPTTYKCNQQTYQCYSVADGSGTDRNTCTSNCRPPTTYKCNQQTYQCYSVADGTGTDLDTCTNNCTQIENRCWPTDPRGCNVCTACCHDYIPDGPSCDACVQYECV